jgi:hypothetical protein
MIDTFAPIPKGAQGTNFENVRQARRIARNLAETTPSSVHHDGYAALMPVPPSAVSVIARRERRLPLWSIPAAESAAFYMLSTRQISLPEKARSIPRIAVRSMRDDIRLARVLRPTAAREKGMKETFGG